MYNHFLRRTKLFLSALCVSAVGLGYMTSCSDSYDLDNSRYYPCWLGGSIYEELENPDKSGFLTSTFTNYLKLIDDLGYTETLSKTGSKTLFVANDEAFERFYANNPWGVTRYEDLSEAMKKQLLYASMLDNAILLEMLSNVSQGDIKVTPGIAMKHELAVNVIDTITQVKPNDVTGILPENNPYWDYYRDNGINMVMDGTRPMMVHFTQEQMTNNNITTQGADSDFEIVTGSTYNQDEATAFVFRNKVTNADIKCLNGYIHQMQDVVVPPSNLAELIRTNGESNYFSQMLERFSCPFYNKTITDNYNYWAEQNGAVQIDSIFEKRYFSQRSQGKELTKDPNGNAFQYPLPFDPGWNMYTNGEAGSDALSDIAAIFVPTDKAMEEYFINGSGKVLIEQYGLPPYNDVNNLKDNIHRLPLDIVKAFLENLMKSSFTTTVPSKFSYVMDDAADPMGITPEHINKNADGTYDVKIANNGVAYMLNRVFAPNRYVAVSAPALLSDNMKIMNTLINDGNGTKPLNYDLNYYAYLLAMSANYGLFIPTDEAFGSTKDWKAEKKYYIDPTYLKREQPRVLRFYYVNKSPYIKCSAWEYDPVTGEVGDSLNEVQTGYFETQIVDMLNYNTVVLKTGEQMGEKKFYKTKHGGTIMYDKANQTVMSGSQIDNGVAVSKIQKEYNQQNGKAFAIDHLIAPPIKSVYQTLSENSQFSEFMALCTYDKSNMDECLNFASDKMAERNEVTNKFRREAFYPFVSKNGLTDNVNYFNSYNYTVFAPNNQAMAVAYSKGLPRWEDIYEIYQQYPNYDTMKDDPAVIEARNKALAMVNAINEFIRYHFVDNSTYADAVIEEGEYATACADTLGVRKRVVLTGGNGRINVNDNAKQNIEVSTTSGLLVNNMTRDYEFDKVAKNANHIRTSSFAVVHEIKTPLCTNETNRYDGLWTGQNAKKKLAAYRKLFETKLYKLY